jgi:hypothetical protein
VPAELTHVGLALAERYRLTEEVARGALSVVYRGQDDVLRRPIAVKAVPRRHVAAFRAALHATAALTHPAIVAVFDVLESDGSLFVIQEYVQARPFATYLQAGLPVERAVDLAGQIARALAYAHAHDVVHGDLTPAAVLVDRRAMVRLNNCCLPPDALYFAEYAHTLEAVGSDATTTRAPHATPATDVRGLGLLLWQALSTAHAADAPREEEEDATRAFRPDVPEAARALVRRAVVRAHPERIVDAETLALALEALSRELASGRSPLSEATPPALRVARELRQHEAPWSLGDTLGGGEPWLVEMDAVAAQDPLHAIADAYAPSPSAPTAPDAYDAGAWGDDRRPNRQGQRIQGIQAGVPRSALPSRPNPPPIRAADPRRRVRPHPPTWPPAGNAERGLTLAALLLIGAALFVLFFLIGFIIQR